MPGSRGAARAAAVLGLLAVLAVPGGVAAQVGNGRHLPKTSAARPMKPVPFVMPSLKECTNPIDR